MISISFVIGLILTVVFVLCALFWAAYWFANDEPGMGWGGIVAMVIVLVIAAFGFFPYNMAYHSYKPVEGTVEKIDKRLMEGSNGLAEKYAVQFEGSTQLYGCEDTRCSVAKPGDTLKLMCIREWEYAGVDGYNCKYNQ